MPVTSSHVQGGVPVPVSAVDLATCKIPKNSPNPRPKIPKIPIPGDNSRPQNSPIPTPPEFRDFPKFQTPKFLNLHIPRENVGMLGDLAGMLGKILEKEIPGESGVNQENLG